MSIRVPPPTLDKTTHRLVLTSGNMGSASSITVKDGTALLLLGLSPRTERGTDAHEGAGATPATVTGTKDLTQIVYYDEARETAGALDGLSFTFQTDDRGPFTVTFGTGSSAPQVVDEVLQAIAAATNHHIFEPQQYPITGTDKLLLFEKYYINLILQISEQFIANNMMNLVIEGWYNVTFDNYPSLRKLLPANYTDTIVGLATQVSIAIQQLNDPGALSKQFTPIGQRHYLHGAEAVTLLCSSPCLVQSMFNVLALTVEQLVAFLKGVAAYPNLFTIYLKRAGQLRPSESERTLAAPIWNPAERRLLESVGRPPPGSGAVVEYSLSANFPKHTSPAIAVTMINPPTVTLGGAVPHLAVRRILEPLAKLEAAPGQRKAEGDGSGMSVSLDLLNRLGAALGGFLNQEPAVRDLLERELMKSVTFDVAAVLQRLLAGELTSRDLDGEAVEGDVFEAIVQFILRYLIPVLLIPFGRFVDRMVAIITEGVRTERSNRLLLSWESQLKPQAGALARKFWLTLLKLNPELGKYLGFAPPPTPPDEGRLQELTEKLALGLTEYFPRITDDGLTVKQHLRGLGRGWSPPSWPLWGYDCVRQAFLATLDATLFTDPVYAATKPALRLQEAYSQLVSVAITELVSGAGSDSPQPEVTR